jgi:hypothetical protein
MIARTRRGFSCLSSANVILGRVTTNGKSGCISQWKACSIISVSMWPLRNESIHVEGEVAGGSEARREFNPAVTSSEAARMDVTPLYLSSRLATLDGLGILRR